MPQLGLLALASGLNAVGTPLDTGIYSEPPEGALIIFNARMAPQGGSLQEKPNLSKGLAEGVEMLLMAQRWRKNTVTFQTVFLLNQGRKKMTAAFTCSLSPWLAWQRKAPPGRDHCATWKLETSSMGAM